MPKRPIDYSWTADGMPNLRHRRLIGLGGAAEVHEMFDELDNQPFARKLIRLSAQFTEDDVDHEIEAIKRLCTTGHTHVVNILRHGWFNCDSRCFIDMELCGVSLKAYIDRATVPLSDSASRFLKEPVFVTGDCSPNLHIVNTWTIMSHIAQGLKIVHDNGYTHRDLKPENVLYSHNEMVWKIADFGLASAATSKRAITTRYARGTDGFRAPELLSEHPKFTNKVDIWAMGCILYQIATRKQLFLNDFTAREFDHSDPRLEISDALVPESACSHLSDCLRAILRNDSQQRPTLLFLNSLFESYCTIWDSSIVGVFDNTKSFPPSSEWMRLIRETTEVIPSFVSLLVDWHESSGRNQLIIPLLNALIEKFPNEFRLLDRLAESYEKARDWDAVIRVRKCIVDGNQDDSERQLEKIVACERKRDQELARREIVRALYLNATGDNAGGIPIHRAAENNDVEAIKVLSEMGADVSGKDDKGCTSLHHAARNGHVEAIKALGEIGANVSRRDINKRTPLHFAAMYGHVEAIKALGEMGADVSGKDDKGCTPLHYAAQNGHVEAIKALGGMGADVSITDDDGWTPLHCAAWNGSVEAIKALGEMGADVSTRGVRGCTPLHYAAQNGHVKAIKALGKMGGDVSITDDDGWTPLHYAGCTGHVEAIKALSEMGADLSTRDNKSRTPLHYAAMYDHVEAIKALGEMKADVSVKDVVGLTPMDYAVRNGHAEAIKILEDMGDMGAEI